MVIGTFVSLFVIPDADVVTRLSEGVPRDVEPAVAGQELVGEFVGLEEADKALELGRILGTDIGGLAKGVLGIANAPYSTIDSLVSKARINNDGAYFEAGWLQYHQATISHVGHMLHRGDVFGVLLPIAEFFQRKVRR